MTLLPEDDLRHPLPDSELARESLYWNVALPEEELAAIAYLFVKPSGAASSLLLAFGPDPAQPLGLDLREDVPFEGTDLDDCRVAGMHLRQPRALETAELSVSGDGLGLEYRFEGLHEAFDYARNSSGSPSAMAQNRFEQGGWIDGALTLGERRVPFATTGERDHSWGTRDWRSIHHYKWISAQAGPEIAINALLMMWRGELIVNGFVFRDGELSPLADLRARTDYDEDFHHQTIELDLIDEAGRSTKARGERFAGVRLPFGGVMIVESACRFEIEGHPGVGMVELVWPEGYMEHMAPRP